MPSLVSRARQGFVRLAAQLCAGNASFAPSHFTAATNFEFDPVAQRDTLDARYHTHHLFAGVEYGVRSWESTSLNGKGI